MHDHGVGKQGNNYRGQIMHKAVCADCKKECEVPFKPKGDRPVYCKECFSKRKAGHSFFNGAFDNKPKEAAPAQAVHIDKPKRQSLKTKAAVSKKKPAAKRRKAGK